MQTETREREIRNELGCAAEQGHDPDELTSSQSVGLGRVEEMNGAGPPLHTLLSPNLNSIFNPQQYTF